MSPLLKRVAFAIVGVACALNSCSIYTSELFFEDSTEVKRRKLKNIERDDAAFKRNTAYQYASPEVSLEPIRILERILADPNRNYMGKICHLHAWQFFLLADHLKPLIERPRLKRDGTQPTKKGPPCKHDHYHRLFFCLQWLNTGAYFRSTECYVGWGKCYLPLYYSTV